MELRAHHLICMPMYSGHGYSQEFCVHLEQCIEKIRNTEEPIRVLSSPDEVCAHCPNLLELCREEERTSRKDRKLLKALGLECGQTYSKEEIYICLSQHFTETVFEPSCGKCSWREQGLCSHELWREKSRELFQKTTI
ncbi:MAG: DUF1284 domain-containing protein [Clostridiales bacterium]|nr:DUF1284 domain-containing protein [Clostridiales bacterium]